MNRNRILASTSLAVALGLSALAPSIAGADPSVSVKLDGSPIDNGATGELGQPISVVASDCIDPNTQQGAYFGLFLSTEGDPASAPALHVMEAPADEVGSFQLDSTIDLDTLGTQIVRFYCSTSPVTSLEDASMLWVSPTATMTVTAPARANTQRAARTSAARTDESYSLVISTDADALPLVDRIGITGTPAAHLKARVDANDEYVAKAENFFRAFYGRTPTYEELTLNVNRFKAGKSDLTVANSLASKSEFDYTGDRNAAVSRTLATATSPEFQATYANENYVVATYSTLAGRIPTASELSKPTAQLDGGLPKVQVVENIALDLNTASYWNTKAAKK